MWVTMEVLNRLLATFAAFILIFITNSRRCILASRDMDYEYVTCGSIIKLQNTRFNSRLHSHDIRYGSGSGQQSVTAVDNTADKNSFWQIKAKQDQTCTRGQPVKCGSTIRLMHVSTRRNLHSHHFSSPLSHNQEVSCFGEDGTGDDGDHFSVLCSTTNWKRNEPVRFKHVVTEHYLTVTGDVFGRPIHGQKEVSCYATPNSSNYWKAVEGVYVKPVESSNAKS
ncbi:stromal cell-derived factor 2-like [Amphiura filiformis]|uniref:stromal cell-derived factor 2-like n=1 Tax=Amphiura filiformis TaxID=82378 RepID=UPI003B20BFA9